MVTKANMTGELIENPCKVQSKFCTFSPKQYCLICLTDSFTGPSQRLSGSETIVHTEVTVSEQCPEPKERLQEGGLKDINL